MRLLAVTPYYEPEGGGLERYAHSILAGLAARGHDVAALSFTKRDLPSGLHGRVPVSRLRPAARVGNTPIHPGFARRVARAIAVHRPDVVVAHTPVPFPAEMAYRAARRAGIPFVATYHAGRLRGSSPLLAGLAAADRATFERAMLDGSRRLIAVSPYVRDNALSRQRERTTIIPPGVDHVRYCPDGVERSAAGILFVGPLDRSYRWKGVDVLLDAFGRLRSRRPDTTLTLVGEGDRRAEFERRAEAEFEGALRVLPRLPDDELIDEYRRAAAVVLPSTTDAESFGMVLAEANACGAPVVGSRIGGIPSFVREGDNGLLAAPGDAQELAECLFHLAENPDQARELGERGRARVVAEHDWGDLSRRTEAVLEDAVRA